MYDALDRVAVETERHGTATPRTTVFSFLGLSNAVSREEHRNGAAVGDPLLTTKTYGYDAWGRRLTMINDRTDLGAPGTGDPAPDPYTYGTDVHGSTSTLLLEGGATPKASYGYTAYGAADNETTVGDYDPANPTEANNNDPLNAYRYTGKRLDTGAADGLNMGARRYSPEAARFLQVDYFNGALSDLALSSDPLTANRYGLAGGNPLSFIEWDGHIVTLDGSGGAAPTPITCTVGCGGIPYSSTSTEFDVGWPAAYTHEGGTGGIPYSSLSNPDSIDEGSENGPVFGVCGDAKAGAAFYAGGSVCIAGSDLSDVSVLLTIGGGEVSAPMAGVAGEVMVAEASSAQELGGPFGVVGGSVSPVFPPVSVTSEYITSVPGSSPHVQGVQVGAGPSVQFPAEVHAGVTYTFVLPVGPAVEWLSDQMDEWWFPGSRFY